MPAAGMTPEQATATLRGLLRRCADRPLDTPERHTPNDFYGHAVILKRYADLPPELPLGASLEHGPFIPSFAWRVDLESPLPAMLCFSASRVKVLTTRTAKPALAVGPPILYARPALGPTAFRAQKNRLGRSLLVFPSHSTHHIAVDWDWEALFGLMEEVGRDFDSVRVCLYWKDVLGGKAEPFLRRGYECVSAGHMFDPEFLPRLRSLIELSDMTLANEYGTQLGYSVLLGRPHVLRRLGIRVRMESEIHRSGYAPPDEETLALCEAFTEPVSAPTPEQLALVSHKMGLEDFRPPEALRAILSWTQRLAAGAPLQAGNAQEALRAQGLAALAQGDVPTGALLLAEGTKSAPDDPLFRSSAGFCREDKPDVRETLGEAFVALGSGREALAAKILGYALKRGADPDAHGPLLRSLAAQRP